MFCIISPTYVVATIILLTMVLSKKSFLTSQLKHQPDLTMLPSNGEFFNAVHSLNKDNALGPEGFGAFFFQSYWKL
jgi:hypothetical protein